MLSRDAPGAAAYCSLRGGLLLQGGGTIDGLLCAVRETHPKLQTRPAEVRGPVTWTSEVDSTRLSASAAQSGAGKDGSEPHYIPGLILVHAGRSPVAERQKDGKEA